MMCTDNFYWYGVSAAAYLVTCWVFAGVRWFHTCRAPKERHSYIWPDRKMQVFFYLLGTCLLPYVLNPGSESAWMLWKSYFPCTYYFYCGALLFCFFGSVKQWNRWKRVSAIAGAITMVAMVPLVLDAWIPGGMLKGSCAKIWGSVIVAVSILMMGYAIMAMVQIWKWMKETRDQNYSNPEDFPADYAHRVWLAPVLLTPWLWVGFITDSPDVMIVANLVLAVLNIILLINVMPAWRRIAILSLSEEDEEHDEEHDELVEERTRKIAEEIVQFVEKDKGYMDAHLKLEHVVEHCSYGRSYVSGVLSDRFGGFSDYVNKLRLKQYDAYMKENPLATTEAAAEASGFTSYLAYHRAKERLEKKK